MNPSKSELRADFKQRRSALSEKELGEFSEKIAAFVQLFCATYPSLDHFHLFLPIRRHHEVDTHLIRAFLNERNKVVYTSYINPISNEMETVLLEAEAELIEDSYGIPIPKKLNPISASRIQVVFIPLLAVDLSGNRIGYGKGYYDRFLAKLNPETLKVGLHLFDPVSKIPKESFDIPLDYCITPKKIINFSIR